MFSGLALKALSLDNCESVPFIGLFSENFDANLTLGRIKTTRVLLHTGPLKDHF